MEAMFFTCLILVAVGLAQAGLMLVHAREHRRFHRRRWSNSVRPGVNLHVALIAPCKGLDPDLRDNLTALFRQRYAHYELWFAVENDADPAVPVIHELAGEHPQVRCRVVTAGLASDCGQKVHNLMCTARDVLAGDRQPDVLAFVDSDARPHADWLGRLVEKLALGKHAVATGYRWYVPQTDHWANRLIAAINHTVIGVMGPHGYNLVWGGAWAIHRKDFTKLGLPEAWRGTLSDDLVVSRLIHSAGLRVGYEPHCLVTSPADFDGRRLFEFLRRQFVVAKVYAPLWWHFAFWSGLVTNACLWGLAGLAVGGAAAGQVRTALTALAGGALIWVLGAFRWHLAALAIRPFVDVNDQIYDRVARLSFWGWPLVALASWLGTAAAAFGRTIVWRGIRYRLDSPRQTTIQERTGARHDERSSHARTTTRAA